MVDMGKKPATYQDVIDAPEGVTAELVDGELFLMSRPVLRHARTGLRLPAELDQRYGGAAGGWWIVPEVELWLGVPEPRGKVLVPDISGWRRARYTPSGDAVGHAVAPDWVCEILSPGTARRDRIEKLPLYAAAGIAHAWIVDPALRTVEAYLLRDGVYGLVATAAGDASPVLPPFPDALSIGGWWWDEPG
jgi:Uma2 family endonuclease